MMMSKTTAIANAGLVALLTMAIGCGGGGANSKGNGPVSGTGTDATGTQAGPAVAPAVGRPSKDVIPREVFFGNPERTLVRISPDGKQLAWLAPKDGVMNVWVAPIGDLAAARAVTADATRPVRQYEWAYTGKHVLYMQDKGGDENFHVFSVELATGKAIDLVPVDGARVELLGTSPRKPTKVILSVNDRDPELFDPSEVDLTTGARTKLFDNPGFADFSLDHDLAVRLGVRPRPDGGLDVEERTAKGWTKRFEIPGDDMLTTLPLGFDKRGTSFYLADSRGRDTGALYAYDLKTGKQRLLAEDARADVSPDSVLMHPTEKTIEAVGFNWDRLRWQTLDKKVAGDFAGLAKVADGDFKVTSQSLDDRTWIVAFFGDRVPTRYYRWDRKAQQGTFLFADRPALEELTLAQMHPVVIPARDGLSLVSYLSLPPASDVDGDGVPAEPLPMVLLVHGGPWGRDVWGFNSLHQLLANRGYAVLSVNFRGSTGFGKNFTNAGNGEWSGKMHDDLLDAVKHAVDGKVAIADKVAIMGGSYGGYATLVGLAMTPDVFACGVDIVGPSSIITLLEAIPPYWAPMVAMFKTRVGDWTTAEGKQRLLAQSPLTHAGKITRPLLIGQGANDPRVKQAESDQVVKAMQAKRIPVSYALFPDEGHGFQRPENKLAFFAVTEAFLSAHLGGVYQPMDGFPGSTLEIVTGAEGIPGLPKLP